MGNDTTPPGRQSAGNARNANGWPLPTDATRLHGQPPTLAGSLRLTLVTTDPDRSSHGVCPKSTPAILKSMAPRP